MCERRKGGEDEDEDVRGRPWGNWPGGAPGMPGNGGGMPNKGTVLVLSSVSSRSCLLALIRIVYETEGRVARQGHQGM